MFFDFSVPIVTVFGSDLQLETCYGFLSLPYLLYLRQNCLSAKMATSPIAMGPCSNNYGYISWSFAKYGSCSGYIQKFNGGIRKSIRSQDGCH